MIWDTLRQILGISSTGKTQAGGSVYIGQNGIGDVQVPISIACGVNSLQGRRPTMEDCHSIELDLLRTVREERGEAIPAERVSPLAFFGVFDGHCGVLASTNASKTLHNDIVRSQYFNDGAGDIPSALYDAFVSNDADFLAAAKRNKTMDGTTACTVLLKDDIVFTANAGDSRAVLGRGGDAVDLSYDHKPDRETEKARIESSGGFVHPTYIQIGGQGPILSIGPARVWPGGLALSRGLGDLMFKDLEVLGKSKVTAPLVSCAPEITRTRLVAGRDRFIIVACDGLWDVMSSQQAVTFVEEKLPAALREASRAVAHSTQDGKGHGYLTDDMAGARGSVVHGLQHTLTRIVRGLLGLPARPAPSAARHTLLSSSAPVDRGAPVSTIGSDGGDDELTPTELAQVQQMAATTVAQQLVQAGYTYGSTDNITALLILLQWSGEAVPGEPHSVEIVHPVDELRKDGPLDHSRSTADLDEIQVG